MTLFAPEPLGGQTGRVAVEAQVVHLAPQLDVRDARVVLEAGAESLRVSLNGKGSAEGPLTAEALIERRLGDYEVEGTFTAGLELGQHLRSAAGQPVIAGPVRVKGSFAGTGRSPAGLASVLEGSGEMSFAGGSLPGIDQARLVQGLSGVRSEGEVDAAVGQALGGGDLRFTAGPAALTIADGILSLGPVAVAAGELSGDLKALIELTSGRTELRLDLAMAGFSETPAVALSYAGFRDRLERSHDAAAFKTRLKARALREEMAKLEQLQREEQRIIEEELRRQEEDRLREKERRARDLEDDLNGLLGVVMTDINRQELARRDRELLTWSRSPQPASRTVTLPELPLETVTPPPAVEPPPVKPEAAVRRAATPALTIAPSAADRSVTSSLPAVKPPPPVAPVPEVPRRYRTNFNRPPLNLDGSRR